MVHPHPAMSREEGAEESSTFSQERDYKNTRRLSLFLPNQTPKQRRNSATQNSLHKNKEVGWL